MPRAAVLRNSCLFVGGLVALACLRVCFAWVLWSDEDYHLAAAIQILHGKAPYRDFWYDKPPLAAVYYLAMGALPGGILRLWDAAYILLCCFLAWRLARSTSRCKSVLVVLTVLPLFIGSTIRTAGWIILFARGGMLDIFSTRALGLRHVDLIYTNRRKY